jgi:uncharacterized caspase-like protein
VAFQHSAAGFISYLVAKDGFGLPESNLLDLFDSAKAVSEQDENISEFLKKRTRELKDANAPATDVLVYYVGHGGFFSPGDQYFLTLHGTAEGSEAITGYPMQSLAKTIRKNSSRVRRYVILDCCFSAAAYQAFQSGPLEAAKQKTQAALPEKGTALLCAAGAKDVAKAPSGEKYTMFSGVMLDVLLKGAPDLPERLSFSDLGSKVQDLIDVFWRYVGRPLKRST